MSFVQLTIANNKQKVYLRANQITGIDKNPKNDLETIVMTTILTANGPVMYSVLEDAKALAQAICLAEKTGELQIVGPRIQ